MGLFEQWGKFIPAMQNASVVPPKTHAITARAEEDRASRKEVEATSPPTHE